MPRKQCGAGNDGQEMTKALIAGILAVVVVFALTHTVFSGLTEPARLLVSVLAGAAVGGVLRGVQLRR